MNKLEIQALLSVGVLPDNIVEALTKARLHNFEARVRAQTYNQVYRTDDEKDSNPFMMSEERKQKTFKVSM